MKKIKIFIICLYAMFVLANFIAYKHAQKFTKFNSTKTVAIKKINDLTFWDKCKAVTLGIDIPKPQNTIKPSRAYETITIPYTKNLEAWFIPRLSPDSNTNKGIIILFHGYMGSKSTLLDKVPIFDSLGYDCLLVDFIGSGGSDGTNCTIGFHEASQVTAAYNYILKFSGKKLYRLNTKLL